MEERYQLCIYSKNNEDFRISVKDEIYGLKVKILPVRALNPNDQKVGILPKNVGIFNKKSGIFVGSN